MTKRINRMEFQEGLAQRLSEAAQGEAQRSWLGVLAGEDCWLLELADAGEIVPLTQLTEVPLTKPWFAGIANIRGTLYSVVDFSAFQGNQATPRNSASRLLLIGARHGINSALLVAKTLGLKNPDSLEPHAETAPRPWVGDCYRDNKGQLWRKMLVKPLLADPDFLNVGQ